MPIGDSYTSRGCSVCQLFQFAEASTDLLDPGIVVGIGFVAALGNRIAAVPAALVAPAASAAANCSVGMGFAVAGIEVGYSVVEYYFRRTPMVDSPEAGQDSESAAAAAAVGNMD